MTNCNASLTHLMKEDKRYLPKFPRLGRAMNLALGPGSEVWALLITSAVSQPVQFLCHEGLFGVFFF